MSMRQLYHFCPRHRCFLARLGRIRNLHLERQRDCWRHPALVAGPPTQFLYPHTPNYLQAKHDVRHAPHSQTMYEHQLDGWRLLRRELLVLLEWLLQAKKTFRRTTIERIMTKTNQGKGSPLSNSP